MALLERQDGVPFAVYTYREVVMSKKASLLKQEFAMLSEEHGEYARIFVLPSGDYEAVFSKDSGYLLGETVWDYFSRPYDFIYCEALDDEYAILVVVRAGSVYLDARLPLAHLQDEFIALESGSNTYDIYISGNVPIAQQAEEHKFTFQEQFVKSFTVLEQPLFPILPVDEALKLIAFPAALAELQLGREKMPVYIVALIVGLATVASVYFLWPEKELPAPVKIIKPPPRDPYQAYKQTLKVPSAQDELTVLASTINNLFTVPGWRPTKIEFTQHVVTASLTSMGGDTNILLHWAQEHQADLQLHSNTATVVVDLLLNNRPPVQTIYNQQLLVSTVYDRLKLISTAPIAVGEQTATGNIAKTPLTITLNHVTTDMLVLYARSLGDLPVVVISGNLTVTDGLLSGKIDIEAIGANS